jgi:acyl carrier protein
MTNQVITDKILEMVCNKFGIEKNGITPESTFYDFGVNSIDIVDVIIDIEKEFRFNIPIGLFVDVRSLSSSLVIKYLASIADYIE